MADNIQTVISQSESVLMAGFESSFRASHFMILLVVFGASTLPTWGKHVTQHGQARCPKWADFISCLCPKVYHESGIRGGVCVYDRLLLSLILSLRGGVVSMVCGRDTNQKKWNTDWFFHGSIFWLYFVNDSWILVLDLVGFASVGALSFSLVNAF